MFAATIGSRATLLARLTIALVAAFLLLFGGSAGKADAKRTPAKKAPRSFGLLKKDEDCDHSQGHGHGHDDCVEPRTPAPPPAPPPPPPPPRAPAPPPEPAPPPPPPEPPAPPPPPPPAEPPAPPPPPAPEPPSEAPAPVADAPATPPVDDLSGAVTDSATLQPAPIATNPGEASQPAPPPTPPRHEAPTPYVPARASDAGSIPDSRPVEFAAPAPAAATEPEPLLNGGFEQSADGWEPANAALTLVRGVEGRGVRITRASSEESFAFYASKEFVARRARSPYRLGAYIRSTSPGMIVCLRVEEYAGGAPSTRERCQPSRGQWQRVKLQGRTTRRGSKLVVSIHVMAALGGSSLDVDSFRLGGRAVA